MVEVTDIKGVGPSKAENLAENDYESVEDIAQADPDNLSEISGISEDRALEYMVSAGDLLDDSEDDEEASGDEFDLTPDEVGEELQDDADDAESDDGPEVEVVENDEEETAESDSEEPDVEEDPEYEVVVDFDSRMEYHTFHAAIMRYHEKQYTSNQPKADAMQKVLDALESGESASFELDEQELNTLHTAVKQCRTDYQGNNLINHMDALKGVEAQINDQRRDYLF
jgi:hypothetical protein